MIRKLFAAAAFVALGTGSVLAADMAPHYAKAPMVEPVWTWTGFYLGGNVGAGVGKNDWGDLSTVFGAPVVSPGVPGGNGTTMGALGGIQAGYNYQAGWVVVGVQGDLDWTGITGHISGKPGNFDGDQKISTSWLSTITGRVGGVVGQNTLVYVKGGGAWTRFKYNINVFDGLTLLGTYPTVSDGRFGWTFGFGTEYHFDQHWSGFVEADYMDFGTKTISFPQGAGLSPLAVIPFTSSINQRLLLVKAGLNYKLY